jgi:Sec-independent protein translocase protein TatA
MFDLGSGEMILLAAIALIAIGPKQLPEVARSLGKMLNELKRTGGEFTTTFLEARDTTNKLFSDAQKSLLDSVAKTGEIIESAKVDIKPVQIMPNFEAAAGLKKQLEDAEHAADPNQLSLAVTAAPQPKAREHVPEVEETQLAFDLDKPSKS